MYSDNFSIKEFGLKITGVNTRQNLSLISKKLPNFRDLISKNKKILNKVFFKDYI